MKPDLILYNGKVFTVDIDKPWAQAIAISGKSFAKVGADQDILPLAGENTTLIDLEGRLVLPGLCDAHIHFYEYSLSFGQVPLAGCTSRKDLFDRIGRWSTGKGAGDKWLISRGWNETLWEDNTLPTKSEFDMVAGDRPGLVWRSDMHCAVANSAALQLTGITDKTPDPAGGRIVRDEGGNPNGLLYELAINLILDVVPDPELEKLEAAFIVAMSKLHQLGITAVHDQRMKDQQEGPLALKIFQRLNRSGQLKLRVNSNLAAHDLPLAEKLGLQSGFGDQYLRLGHVKLFTDGTMGSCTAWMLQPYDDPGINASEPYGINVTPTDLLASEIRQAAIAGFPVSIHAIGDRANRVILDILEEVDQAGEDLPYPHRIEHVQIISQEDVHRLGKGKITASVQPIHTIEDIETAEEVLGKRANQTYNFRSFLDSGALLALGSDAPVANPNPFIGIHAAVFRQRPDRMDQGAWFGNESISLAESITGYTLNGAKAVGRARSIGSITMGKRADMIVLDRDLFTLVDQGVTGDEIANTKVVMTIFDGQIVYQ